MRIIVTGDLHYDVWRSRKPTEDTAGKIVASGGDVLLLAGDTAGVDTEKFERCLELFAGFAGRKMLVAGNHCIWVDSQGHSWEKYEQVLPRLCAEHDFVYLDQHPVVLGEIGFVGSMGWYDYSFRDESVAIPQRFYEHKVAPGAAERLGEQFGHLLAGYTDVPSQAKSITASWMDGHWVKWSYSDLQVVHRLVQRFSEHLASTARTANTIVALTHHLPFAQLVRQSGQPAWRFANAFMGSNLFGQAMLAQPQCRLAICGHSHHAAQADVEQIHCLSVGSTYRHKQILTFDL